MDLKTSLLVKNQLPEFVREDYPVFISFLESYYEFLETERIVGGVSQKNDLAQKLKDLRNISDVDVSLDKFEEQFFKTFADIIPKETKVSKEFIIKNILPFYRSKGTVKSFEFLFRILFDEKIDIEYPKENILRASDGKWIIENILRTELQIYSEYVSDGIKSVYNLPYEIDESNIEITVDDIVFEDYYIRKENKKIFFENIPSLNSVIKILYKDSFNTSIFSNRQAVGLSSNATAIIEKVARRTIGGLNFYQFFINKNNLVGTFTNGEMIRLTVFDDFGNLIPFTLQTFSSVSSVKVINGGTNYNIGDPVLFRGNAIESAIGIVDDVDSGKIVSIRIVKPGRGYTVTPVIDLKFSGDGNATADANLVQSFVETQGRWINEDGMLSNDDMRLQGKNYYVDFSYVISSKVEFQRYKNIIRDLLNPSGSVYYSRFLIEDTVQIIPGYIVFDEFTRQVAGTVNVENGSSVIIGTNTYFEVANSIGLLTEGTYILIDSEIRIVNSIINNTTITVSESYSDTLNDQVITILTFPYNAITTEYWREVAINLEGPRTVVITTEE